MKFAAAAVENAILRNITETLNNGNSKNRIKEKCQKILTLKPLLMFSFVLNP